MQPDNDAVFITETKVRWVVLGLSQDESWTDFDETLNV